MCDVTRILPNDLAVYLQTAAFCLFFNMTVFVIQHFAVFVLFHVKSRTILFFFVTVHETILN